MNEMMLQDVLDHVRNRFYGKYRGTVTEVDAATMRLKANVPAVLPGAPTGVVLDSSGAVAAAGAGKIELGASGVSVNSGALEVT